MQFTINFGDVASQLVCRTPGFLRYRRRKATACAKIETSIGFSYRNLEIWHIGASQTDRNRSRSIRPTIRWRDVPGVFCRGGAVRHPYTKFPTQNTDGSQTSITIRPRRRAALTRNATMRASAQTTLRPVYFTFAIPTSRLRPMRRALRGFYRFSAIFSRV